MKAPLIALALGFGLTLIALLSLPLGLTPTALAQSGTGVIRVALSGNDAPDCGDPNSPCFSLQFAVDEALPGEEIHVAAGIYAGVQVRNGLTQIVYISKSLTIRGGYTTTDSFAASDPIANPTILDAQNSGRVMVITGSGVTAAVENLSITGGTIGGNNLCPESCGGGILANTPLTLTNVTVISNSAGRDGGGVAAMASATLVGAVFEDNLANFDGGGLAVFGPANISNTLFIRNTSLLAGGGAATDDTATITDSRFESNESTFNVAGGLRARGFTRLNRTTIISNVSGASAGIFGITHGGGMYAFETSLVIIDSRFENNRCVHPDCDGGGLYLSTAFTPITLTVTNTNFISNTAQRNGGGVYVNAPATLEGGRFERNQAGGSDLVFSDGGGGIYASRLTVSGTQFINNTSLKDGGGAWASATGSFNGGRFEGNTSDRYGGGLAARAFAAPLTLSEPQFISNTAAENGGGLWVEINGAILNGGLLEGNTTITGDGAGLWVFGDLTLTATQFISNTAQDSGGGAFVENGDVLLNGGLFERNQARAAAVFFSEGGGGLYVAGGNLTSLGTTFIDNEATQAIGGGVLSVGPVELNNDVFQANRSGSSGGGLWSFSPISIRDSQFINNFAEFAGGGAASNEAAFVTNGFFFNNQASFGGGMRATTLTVTNTQFISNFAVSSGGGASASDVVDVSNSLFQDNVSDGSGGGLSGTFDPVTVTDSQFLNNTAVNNGGGILSSGRIFLNNGLFQNNRTTTGSGGGLYTSGLLTLTGTQFISNSAQLDGGGALANSGVVATDGLFERNRSVAGNGGGVSAPLGQFDFENVALVENNAGGDGGGAYTGFRAIIESSRFQDNTAANYGGGMWVKNRTLMTATTFINNQAGGLGGGLVITGTFETPNRLINNLFTRNASTSGNALFVSLPDNPNFPDGEFGLVNMVHNTIATSNGINGSALEVISGTVRITNTIIASHTTGIDNVGGIVTEDFNLFFGNGNNTQGPVSSGANSFVGDPAFVDPTSDDYHLTPDSLAINNAVDAGVLIDFEGDPRPGGGGFDIGYDETDFAPELSLSKTATPATDVTFQSELTYTVILTNDSVFDANGVLLNDTLPAEVDFARWVQQPIGANVAADQITWNGTAPGNGAVTFTFVVSHVGSYGDVFSNTAEFFHPSSGSDGSASAQVSIAGPPILDISKTANPDTNVPNQGEVTYTIVLSNSGQSDALDTLLTDTLPSQVDFSRWVEQPVGANENTDEITWNGTVPANGVVTFTFVVSHVGDFNDIVVNTAEYSHPASSSGTEAEATFTVEPDPQGGPPPAPIYLPLITKNFTTFVDLVVEELIVSSNAATVTIKNIGNAPVDDAFWVDLYIDPDPPPTGVNQQWQFLSNQGVAWGVTDPLPANTSLTLTLGDQYYVPSESNFVSVQPGTPVYAQVDSVNFDTTYGNVLESDETNNIVGPELSILGLSQALPLTTDSLSSTLADNLPKR